MMAPAHSQQCGAALDPALAALGNDKEQPPQVVAVGQLWNRSCWMHAKTAKAARHMIWHNGGTYGSRNWALCPHRKWPTMEKTSP
jgi:hypothetical protein